MILHKDELTKIDTGKKFLILNKDEIDFNNKNSKKNSCNFQCEFDYFREKKNEFSIYLNEINKNYKKEYLENKSKDIKRFKNNKILFFLI